MYTDVFRDIETTIFDPTSVFPNHIDEVRNPVSHHCFYKPSRNRHPSHTVCTTPLDTVTHTQCKVFFFENRDKIVFLEPRDYVGDGRRMDGSSSQVGPGGHDNSGLNKDCRRVRP